jgi:DNA-binding PadR family transcriptional regulator
MVQKEPKNGIEIMDTMESMSRGWWRPSPGSVYPMLKSLTEEGLISVRKEDGRYMITVQGKEELDWPSRMGHGGPRTVEGVLEELSSFVSYMEDLSRTKDSRLSENAEKIRDLSDRLAKLGSS